MAVIFFFFVSLDSFSSDCGGFVSLEESDPYFERNKAASVTSPNYPKQISQGKICRWAIKVRCGTLRGKRHRNVLYNYRL